MVYHHFPIRMRTTWLWNIPPRRGTPLVGLSMCRRLDARQGSRLSPLKFYKMCWMCHMLIDNYMELTGFAIQHIYIYILIIHNVYCEFSVFFSTPFWISSCFESMLLVLPVPAMSWTCVFFAWLSLSEALRSTATASTKKNHLSSTKFEIPSGYLT